MQRLTDNDLAEIRKRVKSSRSIQCVRLLAEVDRLREKLEADDATKPQRG